MANDFHREWCAALDALEADVTDIEAMLAEDHRVRDNALADPWTPPEGLGPLPLDLKPRARDILARQIAATRAIAIGLVANRRQASVAQRIEAGDNGAARPAYVDYTM